MIILEKWSIIRGFSQQKYKIIIGKINNFDTCKILKNRLKKIKSSSIKATLNYLFFEKLLPANINENKIATTKNANGLPVALFLSIFKFSSIFSPL